MYFLNLFPIQLMLGVTFFYLFEKQKTGMGRKRKKEKGMRKRKWTIPPGTILHHANCTYMIAT